MDPIGLQSLRWRFLNDLWRGVAVVAACAIPITLWRASLTGWLPLYVLHLSLSVVILVMARLRRRLSFAANTALLMGLCWSVGMPGVFTFGLAAPGIWWIALSVLIANTLCSPRTAVGFSLATVGVLLVAAIGFVEGLLRPEIPLDAFVRMPASWAALIVATGVFTFALVRGFGRYVTATEHLVEHLALQRDAIREVSLHDRLTGLPNLQLAEDRINVAIQAARREGRRVAVMFIDLDEFKAVNDNHGHEAGDQVLRESAARISAALRGGDTLARLGGDEFIAVAGLLETASEAAVVAAKLVQAAETPAVHEGRVLVVSASIGIALYPDDADDARTLRRLADQAMYVAKRRRGGCRYEFANEHLRETLSNGAA